MTQHPHPEVDEAAGDDDCNHHDEVDEDCEADNARISWEAL